MARRVVIGEFPSSPFRVAAAGSDADTADTFDLLFDGNQSPLRLGQKGTFALPYNSAANLAPAVIPSSPVILQHPSPAGRHCLFTVTGYGSGVSVFVPNGSGGSVNVTYIAGTTPFRNGTLEGIGGVITNTAFYPVNFYRQQNLSAWGPTYFYFHIFKNYQ